MSRPTLTSMRDTPSSTGLTSKAAKKPAAIRSREPPKRRNSKGPEMMLAGRSRLVRRGADKAATLSPTRGATFMNSRVEPTATSSTKRKRTVMWSVTAQVFHSAQSAAAARRKSARSAAEARETDISELLKPIVDIHKLIISISHDSGPVDPAGRSAASQGNWLSLFHLQH